ncbi:hypothetical protein H8356DRAFT_1338556 [Neocallimastix lanati (nom. inval.)]|nr:hypothetical protein H8356DRAFT_1338556 [Neocallimastix sp. JGI-2020a]
MKEEHVKDIKGNINDLGEQTQSIIEGNEKSAYEIWKLLKESFTKKTNKNKVIDNILILPLIKIIRFRSCIIIVIICTKLWPFYSFEA